MFKILLQIIIYIFFVFVFLFLFLVSRRSFTLVADYLVILVKYIIIIITFERDLNPGVWASVAHCKLSRSLETLETPAGRKMEPQQRILKVGKRFFHKGKVVKSAPY